jgi:hypothetical protein
MHVSCVAHQRWIYPVDKKRANEFGFSDQPPEPEAAAAADTPPAALTEGEERPAAPAAAGVALEHPSSGSKKKSKFARRKNAQATAVRASALCACMPACAFACARTETHDQDLFMLHVVS